MLVVSPEYPDLAVGHTVQLIVSMDGVPVPAADCEFISHLPDIATVSSSGLVTGHAPGTGHIEVVHYATRRGGGSFPNIRV